MSESSGEHGAVGTSVRVKGLSELDQLHHERMNHALSMLFMELLTLGDKRVNALLNRWSLCIIPGPRVAYEYAEGVPQVHVSALEQLKAQLKAAEEAGKSAAEDVEPHNNA